NINSRNIALQRLRIAHRPALLGRQLNPQALQKVVVRGVACQCEYEVVLQTDGSARSPPYHVILLDTRHTAAEVRSNLAIFNAVLDIRLDPVFDVMMDLRPAVNQCDPRAVTP